MKGIQKGFTLIEVMVAVAILAFSATAALQLVIRSQLMLSKVKTQRELYREALSIDAEIYAKMREKRGTEGNTSWSLESIKGDMFKANFGHLDIFEEDLSESRAEKLPYNRLTVATKEHTVSFPVLPEIDEIKKNLSKIVDFDSLTRDK